MRPTRHLSTPGHSSSRSQVVLGRTPVPAASRSSPAGSGRIRTRRSTSIGHSTRSHGSWAPGRSRRMPPLLRRSTSGSTWVSRHRASRPSPQGPSTSCPAVAGKGRSAFVVTPPELGTSLPGGARSSRRARPDPGGRQGSGRGGGPRGLRVGPDRYGEGPLTLADDGTEVQTIVLPLGRCIDPRRCTGSIDISVESRADKDATISWDVAVELPLPAQASPARLRIEVERAP